MQREIFISASALAHSWRSIESDEGAVSALRQRLDRSLFFFGSKRMWLFPQNAAQEEESRQQGSYKPPGFPQALLDLIREKEERAPGEVYFLKPPDLDYKGFGNGCHAPDPLAPAFKGASDWLEQHGLNPLLLDREWWESRDDGYKARKSLTGARGKSVVKNYEIGEHDYNPCLELLYQSNPERVVPVHSP